MQHGARHRCLVNDTLSFRSNGSLRTRKANLGDFDRAGVSNEHLHQQNAYRPKPPQPQSRKPLITSQYKMKQSRQLAPGNIHVNRPVSSIWPMQDRSELWPVPCSWNVAARGTAPSLPRVAPSSPTLIGPQCIATFALLTYVIKARLSLRRRRDDKHIR